MRTNRIQTCQISAPKSDIIQIMVSRMMFLQAGNKIDKHGQK